MQAASSSLTELRFPPVLDATMLAAWGCPKKFQLAHLHRYGHEKSIHLIAGAAYARGLEVARRAYWNGSPPDLCLMEGTKALIIEYGDAICPPEEAKTCERMIGAMEFYFDQYPLETDPARIATVGGVPAVEWSFGLPLPFSHPDTGEPLLFAGRTDALMDFAGGLYALDDKTTKQLGVTWPKQWELRSQFTGYAWAARELGLKLAGTLVRGVSILKTKYDHAQAIVNQPEWKIDRWVAHRDHVIRSMLDAYRTGYFDHNLGEVCNEYGGCGFKPVCAVPPEDQPSWLATNYIETEWNPLMRD